MTLCDGFCDDCTGEVACHMRPNGYGPAYWFCAPCAAAYDRWLDNYEPPEADGEAFRGGEAVAYQRDQMAAAQRLK